MRRKQDWPEQLHAHIKRHHLSEFEWGEIDCGTFMFDGLLAMTGEDAMDGVRAQYDNPTGLTRALIKRWGTPSLVLAMGNVAKAYGWREVEALRMQRGDPCVFMGAQPNGANSEPTCGLCIGEHIVAMGHRGLTKFKLDTIICPWHVPA